jgi:hypothetical protein
MPPIDDTFARFCKPIWSNRSQGQIGNTPICWKHQIGITTSLPRAIDYYMHWRVGIISSDRRYHHEQLAIVTVYFQQWLAADCWLTADNTALNELRSIAASVKTMEDLRALHKLLVAARIDPIQ